MKQSFTVDNAGIGQAVDYVRAVLESKKIRGKTAAMTALNAEESMLELVAHSSEESQLSVYSFSFPGSVTFEFSIKGDEYDFPDGISSSITDYLTTDDSSVADSLRRTILYKTGRNLQYKHKNGVNTVRLTVSKSSQTLIVTLGALFAAIVAGVLLAAFAPSDWNLALDGNFLTPVKNMYMNALKMIAAPVVFFSIVGCFSQQSNPSGLGRIGGKIIGTYMITTLIAVCVGIGSFFIFRPGDPSVAAGLTADVSAYTSQEVSISVKDMIVGIVPSNFLSPFIESNMLQLIFLAVLCGIAVGLIGDYSVRLRELFEALGELFLKITSLVMRFTPLAVFCSILSMVLKTGPSSLLSVAGMMGAFLFGLVIMMIVYSMILVISGLNPLHFFKLYAPSMLQVFSLASSNAAITINLEACNKKLHISPKVYGLSIPLGATINMDGTSVLLAVQALTIAQIYGVDISRGALITLAFSIILMSVGAPGVPGSGVIILSMLLSQLGVPVEGVALVIGIGPLVGMFISMCNCLGDVIITTAVAKSEKLMDLEAYRKKS